MHTYMHYWEKMSACTAAASYRGGDSYQKVGGRNLALTPDIPLLLQNSEALEWTNKDKTGGALPPQF